MTHDILYGLRMLGKSRGFTIVAIASLAAGIGLSTLVFSFASSFVLRPIHAASPSQIVQLFPGDVDGPSFGAASYADYEDIRDRTPVFSGLLASTRVRATLSDGRRRDIVAGVLVSENYFEVLGLRPSAGRFFRPEENISPNTHPVLVLSHEAWQRRFDSVPDIVGRTVTLNGHAFTVIGVGPPQFSGTSIEQAAEFFAPVMMDSIVTPDDGTLRDRSARRFTIFGRLKPESTLREADAALRVVAAQLALENPAAWLDRSERGRTIAVLPELEARFADAPSGTVLWIFSSVIGTVVFLLGIACVNVATVLLARATTRRKEIAVRLAMGASRWRVVRQLLTECALLAAAGGLLGVLFAQWTAALFGRFRPAEVPPFDLTIDYRIVMFSLGASLLTVLLCGLAPALQSTRPDINADLKDSARTARLRRHRIGLRDGLVIVQMAVSLTLIVGAALLFRSLLASRTHDPGFRREGVLNVEIDLSTLPDRSAQTRFYREAVDSVASMPGVEGVALAALVPLDGTNRSTTVSIDRGGSAISTSADTNVVGPGYFALLDIPVIQGREFTLSDREGAPNVAVVNESMAREFWQGQAIGQVFRDETLKASVEIVGIVRDLRHRSLDEAPRPMIYFSADQRYHRRMTMHLRSSAPASSMRTRVVQLLHDIHPVAGIVTPRSMTEYMSVVTMPQRIGSVGAATVGVLELGLAVMALYGVIAFTTAQRTREIGVRMALGASNASIARLIMRDGLRLGGAGVALGVLAASIAGPLLQSLLIGIGAADPLSFAVAAASLLIVTAIASYLPARRALRVDPSAALRAE